MTFAQLLRTQVACTLLTDWIPQQQLAILDSALCSTTIRPLYLALVASKSFVLEDMSLSLKTYPFVLWITKRRIRARNWDLTDVHTFTRLYPALVKLLAESTGGPHVRCLYIGEAKQEAALILTTLTSVCTKITEVSFVNCEDWTSLCMLSGEAQHSLRSLSVRKAFKGLWECKHTFEHHYFPNLVQLHLEGDIGAWATESLLAVAPNLTRVEFCHGAINDSGLHTLSHIAAAHLQHLALRSCKYVSWDAVVNLADQCTRLKSLVLRVSLNNVVSEDVVARFKGIVSLRLEKPLRALACPDCTVPSVHASTLKNLSLHGLKFFGSSGLLAVAQNCSLLEKLELCDCTGLRSKRLVQIVSSMPLLRALLLTACTTVTDAVLIAIAKRLPGLTALGLYGSTGYTSRGAIAVIGALQHLRHFNVSADDPVFNPVVLYLWQGKALGLQVRVDGWSRADDFEDRGNP